MLGPKIIGEYDSKFSGKLIIKQEFPWGGDKYISTDNVTQSGWIVREIWKPILRKIAKRNKAWLILGVAGCSVPKIIASSYSPLKITGVEIDPVMIEIGERYFGLNEINSFDALVADGEDYVSKYKGDRYDYLLVDMYIRDRLPEFVYGRNFLSKLSRVGNTVVINHLYFTDEHKTLVQDLIDNLEKFFANIILERKHSNILIICTN